MISIDLGFLNPYVTLTPFFYLVVCNLGGYLVEDDPDQSLEALLILNFHLKEL